MKKRTVDTKEFKSGDTVQIIDERSPKDGMIGTIRVLFSNGASINLANNRFTVVKFEHLKKYESQ